MRLTHAKQRYGSGGVDDAATFGPAPPLVSPAGGVVDWAGSYLHNLPGPVAG